MASRALERAYVPKCRHPLPNSTNVCESAVVIVALVGADGGWEDWRKQRPRVLACSRACVFACSVTLLAGVFLKDRE